MKNEFNPITSASYTREIEDLESRIEECAGELEYREVEYSKAISKVEAMSYQPVVSLRTLADYHLAKENYEKTEIELMNLKGRLMELV